MEPLDILFYKAVKLFGVHSSIAAAVQNPGTLKKQDDVEDVFREVNKLVIEKQKEYVAFIEEVKEWRESLKQAFIEGKV
jgi:hypothetical protein